jgi:hypothetical protein
MPDRVRGQRPGSHSGLAIGAGNVFVSHANLYDRPDPRRLDLRASLRSLRNEWLVRVNRQRAGISVHAVIDVSASMSFGTGSKGQLVHEFLEALGLSAFRTGDALGLLAFDSRERSELLVPPRMGRGVGSLLRERLSRFQGAQGGARGLEQAAMRLAGKEGLVFVVSDFHWPLERLGAALDLLAHSHVVPLVVWDAAETEPPAGNGFALLRDAESGARRTLWLRPSLRARWREAVSARREQLDGIFAAHWVRPLYLHSPFDADELSRYFFSGEP